jgi:hydroxyacylglutathione hydrolase
VSDRDLVILGAPLGRWQTNCFVLGDRSAGRAVVIDPGETADEVVPGWLDQLGLTCEAILLTHGHIDHFWGMPGLARALDVPVHMHEDDRWLWEQPDAGLGSIAPGMLEQQLGLVWDPPTDRLETVSDGQVLAHAGLHLTVRHNPGHTPGHVTFLGRGLTDAEVHFTYGDPAPADAVLFSGDLVFAGSIGRTDFPRGSTDAILRSLAETVLTLEDDVVILSGHGPDTTVGRERATNPFLAEARQRHGG